MLARPEANGGGSVYRAMGDVKPEHPVLSRTREILARDKTTAKLLDEHGRGLALAGDGFLSKGRLHPPGHGDLSHMSAILPHRADDVTYLSAGGVERWAMTLSPEGRARVPGVLDRGRVVYSDALPHADVIVTGDDRWIEELVLLRDPDAPTTFKWKVQLGAGLKRRNELLPDGSIDFLDGNGDAALRIHRPFAIDAKGTRVDANMALAGDELIVSLDAKGLAYPVVLDPVAEVPLFQYISSGPFIASDGNGVAWNPTTSKTTMLGGAAPPSYLADSYTWNGSTWTGLGVSSGLAQRYGAAVSDWGVPTYGGVIAYGGTGPSGTLSDTWMNNGSWFWVCGPCSATIAAGSAYYYFPGAGTDPSWTTSSGGGSATIPAMSGLVAANYGSRLVMFGTDRNTYTFEWGSKWSLFPLTSSDTQYWTPPARVGACMAGDTTTGHAIMVGGNPMAKNAPVPGTLLADAWEFYPTAAGTYGDARWKPICGQGSTVGCPFAPRSGCSMAYDATRGKTYLFGGASTGDANDLWEFDDTTKTWTMLLAFNNSVAPHLEYGGMAYDQGRKRVVLTAGYFFGFKNATYEIYVRGGSCSSDAQCDTGHCVEGTCCESVCTTCQTCADPSSPGVCKNVAAGVTDPLSRCPSGGQCNGSGACKPPLGASCSAGSDCASGYCVNATCCATSSCGAGLTCANTAGTCKKALGQACLTGPECASGNCVDGVCCSAASCGAGKKCNYAPAPGTCLSDNGQACSGSTTCGSGNCVDGVCCNTACTGQCAACDVAGAVGTCVPVSGAPHGSRAACAGTGTCAATCNGVDVTACKYPGSSVACGVASCTAGVASPVGQCDGSGGCYQTKTSCGTYTCGGTACKTSCTVDSDCATGAFCKSGACIGISALGEACVENSHCASGFCTDGVCCKVASCGDGSACAGLGTRPGDCLKRSAATCTEGNECASGHCVDSRCCDKACDGQCEACDIKGSEGTCTPVTGAPHGSRAACDTLEANDCAKATCNGDVRDKCAGWANGTTTPCGEASCTADKKVQKIGACDGRGACSKPDPISCVEYACDPSTKDCRTSCAADTDCADDFTCDTATGKCVQGVKCSEDHRSSVDKAGVATDCAPYTCGTDGRCQKACATTSDCVPGAVCNTDTKACVGATPEPADSGGCATTKHSSSNGGGLAGLGIALLLLRRNRRRRSAAGR